MSKERDSSKKEEEKKLSQIEGTTRLSGIYDAGLERCVEGRVFLGADMVQIKKKFKQNKKKWLGFLNKIFLSFFFLSQIMR